MCVRARAIVICMNNLEFKVKSILFHIFFSCAFVILYGVSSENLSDFAPGGRGGGVVSEDDESSSTPIHIGTHERASL